jgi:hypothetical protein
MNLVASRHPYFFPHCFIMNRNSLQDPFSTSVQMDLKNKVSCPKNKNARAGLALERQRISLVRNVFRSSAVICKNSLFEARSVAGCGM